MRYAVVNLRADPFERADQEAADYAHWRIDRIYLLVPAQAFVGSGYSRRVPAAPEAGDLQPRSSHRKTLQTAKRR
jgi:hypothetical protein